MSREVVETCGGMPNQFEGRINDRPFYYRARHGYWELTVGAVGAELLTESDDNVVLTGEDSKAGWWNSEEALEQVNRVLNCYEAL